MDSEVEVVTLRIRYWNHFCDTHSEKKFRPLYMDMSDIQLKVYRQIYLLQTIDCFDMALVVKVYNIDIHVDDVDHWDYHHELDNFLNNPHTHFGQLCDFHLNLLW